ncbi:MAG: tyrosine-type recombinase/integrase [Dehalococcoidia bacterium]|nr:tyrosine-type recombinase/integrase [Dehalococcoidia bacterium]
MPQTIGTQKCNPRTFRRAFASNLPRAGLDVEHIMRPGGWESLDVVVRYTRLVKFEDNLRLYRGLEASSKAWSFASLGT